MIVLLPMQHAIMVSVMFAPTVIVIESDVLSTAKFLLSIVLAVQALTRMMCHVISINVTVVVFGILFLKECGVKTSLFIRMDVQR